MSLFTKYFSVRFHGAIVGTMIGDGAQETLPFQVLYRARGAERPAQNLELAGTVTVKGTAGERPFLGRLERDKGLARLRLEFTDDELEPCVLELELSGSVALGRWSLVQGRLLGSAGQVRSRVSSCQPLSPLYNLASLRLERRPRRPVYRDRLSALLRREPRPLPLRSVAVRLAEAAFPPGQLLEGGGEETIKRAEQSILSRLGPARAVFFSALLGIEWLAWLGLGTRFSRASLPDRSRWLAHPRAESRPWARLPVRLGFILIGPQLAVVINLLKFFNVNTDEVHQRLRTRLLFGVAPDLVGTSRPAPFAPQPPEPWEAQIRPADRFDGDEVIEADALVIGTGAGGGPVAKELAERGLAVAVIEAGRFIRREESTLGSQNATFALGNGLVLHPFGRAAGGTTFINAGTCFRTPDEVLLDWVKEGLPDFDPERMAPYFERVEEIIKVTEADPRYVGAVGEVIRQGCERLGFHSKNLRRNAPLCEGEALCSMGCPHGAKLSTEKSYLPLALKSKASLFTGFTVREIITSGERAIGVHAYGRGRDGRTVRLSAFGRAVILCAGALHTPVLIQRNGLVRGNRWVGGNLSFHPATGAAAIIPGVEMKTHQCIPQGYCVDEFQKEGIMFEGGNIPLSVWALMQRGVGRRYVEMVEKFPNMANFGYMVEDTSRGRVRPGIGQLPLLTYWMNKTDLNRLVRGMAILSRIFLAAGAERVFAATVRIHEMATEEDVARFESRPWRPRHFFLSAYHALGTCRIGPGPGVSAIGPDFQCHAVPGLYVADGSAVPGSLGVNPQETIMAVATLAAEKIAERLEG